MEAGKSKVKVPAGLFFGGVSLLGLPTAASYVLTETFLSACLFVVGGEEGISSLVSLIGTLILLDEGSTLMTLFNLIYFLP